MADETPAPLSDAALEVLRRNIDDQLREHHPAYVTDAHSMARLLATIAALQRQVDAAHLDVAYQVTAADAHAHHTYEADAARDRQIEDLTHENEALRAEVAGMRGVVAAVASLDEDGNDICHCSGWEYWTSAMAWVDAGRPHKVGCMWTRARAILAASDATGA